MRNARLLELRRDDENIIGEFARDRFRDREAARVNAVVIGDENAHAFGGFARAWRRFDEAQVSLDDSTLNVHNDPNCSGPFSGGFLMRLRLSFLLAALLAAVPGCVAAFEAYVAAEMPLQVSPSVGCEAGHDHGGEYPVQCPGMRPLVPGAIWRHHGLCAGGLVIPGAPPTAPGSGLVGFLAAPVRAACRGARPAQRRLCAARRLRLWLDAILRNSPEPYCEEPARRGRCGPRKTFTGMRVKPPM